MSRGHQGGAIAHVQTLFQWGATGGLTDGELLERFRSQPGEAAERAFAALVDRHGPMVLRVCLSVLRDPDDARDAFQATFLVLVRRAGSLWVRDTLGPWLHQVARHTAASARSAAARRRRHEREAAGLATSAAEDRAGDDLGAVLHDEVGRLNERYRAAVVLCMLQGLTHEQAARHLGCPVGTVQSRLARGKKLLKDRLTRRGVAPNALVPAAGLPVEVGAVAVPAGLTESTARAATVFEAGRVAAGAVPATLLAEGVLRGMLMTKIQTIAAALLIAAAGAGGTAVLAFPQSSPGPESPDSPAGAAIPPGRAEAPQAGPPIPVGRAEAPQALPGLPGPPVPVVLDPLTVKEKLASHRIDIKLASLRIELSHAEAQHDHAQAVLARLMRIKAEVKDGVSRPEILRAEGELKIAEANVLAKQAEIRALERQLNTPAGGTTPRLSNDPAEDGGARDKAPKAEAAPRLAQDTIRAAQVEEAYRKVERPSSRAAAPASSTGGPNDPFRGDLDAVVRRLEQRSEELESRLKAVEQRLDQVLKSGEPRKSVTPF